MKQTLKPVNVTAAAEREGYGTEFTLMYYKRSPQTVKARVMPGSGINHPYIESESWGTETWTLGPRLPLVRLFIEDQHGRRNFHAVNVPHTTAALIRSLNFPVIIDNEDQDPWEFDRNHGPEQRPEIICSYPCPPSEDGPDPDRPTEN